MSSERRYHSPTGRSTNALIAGAFSGRTLRTMSTASAEMSPLMLRPEGLGLGTSSCFECCRSLMQTDSNAWSHPPPWRVQPSSTTPRWASEDAQIIQHFNGGSPLDDVGHVPLKAQCARSPKNAAVEGVCLKQEATA